MFKNINPLRIILAVLIVFIPLYPKFPLLAINNTYVAIRLDDIVVGVTFLVWLTYQIKHRFPVFRLKIIPLFIAYFIAIFASAVSAFLIYQVTPANILLLHLLRRFEYISLFFIALDAVSSTKNILYPYLFILFSTLLVSAYGYGQKFYNLPVVSTMNEEFSKGQLLQMESWTRISSTFAGHYDLAAFLSTILIVIGAVFVTTKNHLIKIASLLVWLPSFQILTYTASRVSTFAFWGGMVITFLLIKKYLWIIPVSVLVITSIVSSKDLNQRLLATIPAIQQQLANRPKPTLPPPTPVPPTPAPKPVTKVTPVPITPTPYVKPTPTVIRHGPVEKYIPIDTDAGVARSGEIRFNVEWPRAINAFKANIITGTGLGSITLATDNDYLRLLGESGILGFITFMVIILYFIIRTFPFVFAKKRNRYQTLSLIFLGALTATLANAVFIDVFEASKTAYMFWIMMAIYYRTLELAASGHE